MSEVPILPPRNGFVRVPSFDPGPQCSKHVGVHVAEGSFRHHMTVVVGPASEFEVQVPDQLCRLDRRASFYRFPNIIQEAFYRSLGGLDEHLARVLAYVESQKIKAILDVRDTGFLFREFQTTFLTAAIE